MPQYLLLIYGDESAAASATPEDFQREYDAYGAFTKDLQDRGVMRGGEALQPTNTATTVRVKGGETLTTDGPFAETKEQLGGFYLVEVDHLDDAIKAAAMIPGAQHGCIEVRPVMEYPEE